MLEKGSIAPDIEVTDHNGRRLRLDDLCQQGPVAVYFFPRAFTPGCMVETAGFRSAYGRIRELGGELIGVSVDDASRSCAFADKMGVDFPMVSDAGEHIISRGFGVLRSFPRASSKRVTFVIGKGRKIEAVFAHELLVKKHVSGVLDELERLSAEK